MLTIQEIISEVSREAKREHHVSESESWNWPRFPLSKVVPLCSEIERLQVQVGREQQIIDVWNRLQAALDRGDSITLESYYISRYEADVWHRTGPGGIPTGSDVVKATSLLDLLTKALPPASE
jgi:hypothetical protein